MVRLAESNRRGEIPQDSFALELLWSGAIALQVSSVQEPETQLQWPVLRRLTATSQQKIALPLSANKQLQISSLSGCAAAL
jgi:hypothetical protein